MVRSVTPVSWLVRTSATSGRMETEGSVMIPVSVPVELCAHIAAQALSNIVMQRKCRNPQPSNFEFTIGELEDRRNLRMTLRSHFRRLPANLALHAPDV